MKKIIFTLLALFITLTLSAQITVYEYKSDKTYCTFELDGDLQPDSIAIKGTYRALNFYDIPYFEMTFVARSYILETGETVIAITPEFYYHSFLAKLVGQREQMSPKYYKLTLAKIDNSIADITPEAERNKVFKKSVYTEKKDLDFTKFPPTFTKVKEVNWKVFPKELKKSLQQKDRNLGRRY